MDAPEVTPTDPLPPKLVGLQARRPGSGVDDGASALSPAGRPVGRLERRMAGEFPILEAFQQFLEAERRRARQHMIMLTAGFVVALLVVVGLGVAAGFVFYRQLEGNVADVSAGLQALQNSQGETTAKADSAVKKLARDSATLQKQVQAAAATQKQSLDGQAKTIAALKAELARLEQRNRELNGDLESMQQVVPSLSSDMGLVLDMLENLKASQAAAPVPAAVEPPLRPPPAPPAAPAFASAAAPVTYVNLPLTIVPQGAGDGITWQLLIPE